MDLSKVKKYGQISFNQWVALGNKVGGIENVKGVLKGDLEIVTQEAEKKLFDKHGRRISKGLQANVCDANELFRLEQPLLVDEIDYFGRILRLHESLNIDTLINDKQFKAEVEHLLRLIWSDPLISNLANGVWLPVILPKFVTDDIGIELEFYLAAVRKSYTKTFSNRKFQGDFEGILAGEVNVVHGSRHDQLIERMKQGSVIGIHFPNPLQGFSINAEREQMLALPKGFILSGLDTIIAMVMYPDILASGWSAPALDLAAFSWQFVNSILYFNSQNHNLSLNNSRQLAEDSSVSSGGLLFID